MVKKVGNLIVEVDRLLLVKRRSVIFIVPVKAFTTFFYSASFALKIF